MNWRALGWWVCAVAAVSSVGQSGRSAAEERLSPPATIRGESVGGEAVGEVLLIDLGGAGSPYGSGYPGLGGVGSPYGSEFSEAYSRFGLAYPVAEASLPEVVATQREQLLASLRQLQDAYCRAAMLDEAIAVRDQIRALESLRSPLPPVPTPATPGAPGTIGSAIDDGAPYSLRGRNGESFYAEVTGRTSGSVWGDDVYTDDSDLATAAVHAGALKEGETKVVKFTILPGKDSYGSSSENGVSTSAWGSYGGSYRIDAAGMRLTYPYTLRGQGHERLQVFVVGDPDAGTVWGTDVYTDDSALDAAAVHAGIVSPGQKAIVTIELLAGQDSYDGSERNGVRSRDYGSWQASYRFLREESPATAEVPQPGATEQTPYELRGRNGETFTATVTGWTGGSVWGDVVYTDDSDLATAAVHAGVLDDGETGTVRFTILPGEESYGSSTKNGVTSRSWSGFGGSFRIEGAEDDSEGESSATGARESIQATGSTSGTVWGSGVYTSDSDIGTAAVHAGFLQPGETGLVTIERLPGRDSYSGSSSNGVTTYDYGSWSGSFRFVDQDPGSAEQRNGSEP